eukprot:2926866-Rhodomonas_salina.2
MAVPVSAVIRGINGCAPLSTTAVSGTRDPSLRSRGEPVSHRGLVPPRHGATRYTRSLLGMGH